MGIGNYAAASSGFVKELAESLTSEDIKALTVDLKRNGLRAWTRWKIAHVQEVADYVAATPGQRAKKKAWSEPALRRMLVLAAIDHCQAAALLLGFLRDHEAELLPGGRYRDTTAVAGMLYWQLAGSTLPVWPKELERVCPSPFET